MKHRCLNCESFELRYEASQEALSEVMSELTECRKENAILFRRLTKSKPHLSLNHSEKLKAEFNR